jgi:restriction system protein
MKWKMNQNSLFAMLLRSAWWKSIAIAAFISLLSVLLLPDRFKLAGAVGSLPFVVIGLIAARRQFREPRAAAIEKTAGALLALDWARFAPLLQSALARDGYAVQRSTLDGADFEMLKAGRRGLVLARRWKGAHVGIEPLRALRKAADAGDFHDAIYIALGEPSEAAQRFAQGNGVQLWGARELAALQVGVQKS